MAALARNSTMPENGWVMKIAIVLPDGAADEPVAALGGRTPLAAAHMPNVGWIAARGRVGRVVTVPPGFIPGTDVATLTLFGYDPHRYYSGRAPIEAAAQGRAVGPDELVFRCNFVTIENGLMKDFTAGHIRQDEADRLIAELNRRFTDGGCRFHSGVSYRNLMLLSDARRLDVECSPPHDIPNRPVADHRPRGVGAGRIQPLMDRAADLLRNHEVNRERRRQGKDPVTNIWLWGQGRPTALESFSSRFGFSGVVITAVDIIRGLAVMMGMELIAVPGATGYIDTNYAGKGEAAVRALNEHDLVVVHIEAPDEAGHLGDAAAKVESLERIDEVIVGPLLDALRRHNSWKILVAPDHPTPVTTRAHSAAPPPFCVAGSAIAAVERLPFSESAAERGVLIDPGHQLMEFFLRS